MTKLQKKLEELELYLQEKDKSLLEQETQLSELNDQYHELLKSEDSLKTQLREKQQQIDELNKKLKFENDSWQLKYEDMQHQLTAKDASLQDAFNVTTEKEIEIQRLLRETRQAEEAIKEYRQRNSLLEEQQSSYQQKYQEFQDENEQIKQDFQAILNYKNELEMLIEEQTQNIEQKNKRMLMLEETLRLKESDLEKKESLLRRMSQGADETKKKLTQSEMKLRQLTQTTLRDMKVKLKDKLNEIEVLKEMVKSANKQAKAKDIDVQRLQKRIMRLEKMTELGKGIIQDGHNNMAHGLDIQNPIIEDDADMEDTTTAVANTFITPQKHLQSVPSSHLNHQLPPRIKNNNSHDPLGLNPINYTSNNGGRSVEEEVQLELIAAQQQRQYPRNQMQKGNLGINQNNSLIHKAGSNYRNSKQKEIEEAMELDRMLEQERRNQSQDVFAKKYEQKLENYYNNLANAQQSNMKNHSTGVKGIFGGDNDDATQRNNNDSLRYYEGMLPNLNVTKKEQLERELMAEINNDSASRKDKYMTPNLQGKSKIVNKLNHAAYGGGGNGSYINDRNKNNSKNRIQL